MKTPPKCKISPLGECALIVNFGNEISEELSDVVASLAAQIESDPFPGFRESVPAYSSLTLFFDLKKSKRNFRTALTGFEIVKSFVEIAIQKTEVKTSADFKTVEIPASFSPKDAPDLDHVAEANGLSKEKVLEIFLSKTYRVFMLGFLPGFPYMGKLDERIATPRKESPATKVAKGSVGIAGSQTGIYPLQSPGGWQIIGRTKTKLFDATEDPPALLKAGDRVKFIEE